MEYGQKKNELIRRANSMNSITKLIIAATAAALFPAMPLAAQDANAIALRGEVMAVKTTTGPDGKQRTELIEPAMIVPGDRLVFGTDYANQGSDVVTNFTVTNPLPAAVRLAPDADPSLQVSVDDGKTWGLLSSLTVTQADGTTRPASHADVTHVRWVLPSIAPGVSGKLTYPAIIR